MTLSKSLFQIVQQLGDEDIEILPILPEHVLEIETMPFYHRDPFDRIIIAQAQVENLTIVSDNAEFAHYPVKLA